MSIPPGLWCRTGQTDNLHLRYAIGISPDEIRATHGTCKKALFNEVAKRTGQTLNQNIMTIGFARRAATYERADLIFRNRDRLKGIARNVGKLQIIFGGKAHPNDSGGKELIQQIADHARALKDFMPVVYLKDFDWRSAPLLYSGVDLWLNTPNGRKRPRVRAA